MHAIFAIVEQRERSVGHNVTAEVCQLAGPNPYSAERLYPTFTTKELAESFLETLPSREFYRVRALALVTESDYEKSIRVHTD